MLKNVYSGRGLCLKDCGYFCESLVPFPISRFDSGKNSWSLRPGPFPGSTFLSKILRTIFWVYWWRFVDKKIIWSINLFSRFKGPGYGSHIVGLQNPGCLLTVRVYGCFTHLRIVHPTDRPAWMVHCLDCPLYGLPTITTRRQLGSSTPRIHHRWSNH